MNIEIWDGELSINDVHALSGDDEIVLFWWGYEGRKLVGRVEDGYEVKIEENEGSQFLIFEPKQEAE